MGESPAPGVGTRAGPLATPKSSWVAVNCLGPLSALDGATAANCASAERPARGAWGAERGVGVDTPALDVRMGGMALRMREHDDAGAVAVKGGAGEGEAVERPGKRVDTLPLFSSSDTCMLKGALHTVQKCMAWMPQ